MIGDKTINEASYLVDITFSERKHRQVFKNGFRPFHIQPVEHKVRPALQNRTGKKISWSWAYNKVHMVTLITRYVEQLPAEKNGLSM